MNDLITGVVCSAPQEAFAWLACAGPSLLKRAVIFMAACNVPKPVERDRTSAVAGGMVNVVREGKRQGSA